MHQDDTLEAFCAAFNKLDKNCTELLYELYTDDVVFIDPLHRIEGIEALASYFQQLYENVTSCHFDFHDRLVQDNRANVSWTMYLRHPRLAGGGVVKVEGCSLLVFAAGAPQRVSRHRDYFDVGAMLYEQLPLVGPLVRWTKQRVTA